MTPRHREVTRERRRAATAIEPHVLREHALLADGHRGAVLGPRGDIVWLCFPGWDGDPLFGALLGGRGVYTVTPVRPSVWGGQYEEGSLIWRNRWTAGATTIECREALGFPGEPGVAVVLRRVLAPTGDVRVTVRLGLVEEGGTAVPWRHHRGVGWTAEADGVHARLSGLTGARARYGVLSADVDVEGGGYHDLVLELSQAPFDRPPADPARCWAATEQAWRAAVPDLDATAAPRDASHAVAVLRGLTTPDTGAMVAAVTTSLPERARAGRNYDYRYAWVRDQCYAGHAGARLGPSGSALLDDAVRFVTARLLDDGPSLRPAYRVTGDPVPAERQLDLPGYPGAPDVYAGNHAGSQFQLDVFGEALTVLADAGEADRLDGDGWRAIEVAIAAIEQRWAEPDAGVWELDARHWAHSRFACASGLRAVAERLPAGPTAGRCLSLADALVASADRDCLHPSGRWQRAPSDPRIDASLLLAQVRGVVPVDDPRSTLTRRAVADELLREGYVYRYQAEGVALGRAEGAFLLCGFWLALAAAQAGDPALAARVFERNRSACGPPGILTEEFDVHQRQLRGNFPQAFVHALLLETSVALADVLVPL